MNRSSYLAIALSTTLASGVLLAINFSRVPLTDSPPAFITPALDTNRAKLENFIFPLEPTCHDPALIKQSDYYYVFYTGNTINTIRSKDLIHWEFPTVPATSAPVLATATSPARAGLAGRGGGALGGRGPRPGITLPGMPNSISALALSIRDLFSPNITYYNGKYLLFYSAASSSGARNAAIGLATNKTLDPASRDYQWHDEGVVLRTTTTDTYNAIDPNFVLDEKNQPWLALGSSGSGIKLRKLTPEGKPDPADTNLYAIAARTPPETAIEAPFIIHEGRYFYLFVSCDNRITVGRAERITGPYLDQQNHYLIQGGGTQLLASDPKTLNNPNPRLLSPGHPSLFKDGNQWLMAHHFSDGTSIGTSRLQIRPVSFDNQQWPVVGKPINSP